MRSFSALLTVLVLAVTLLTGCAGGGEDSLKSDPNVYQGIYNGTWSSPRLSETGTFAMTIDPNGNFVAGTMTIDQLQASGTLRGRVSYNGQFDYDDGPNPEGSAADFGNLGLYELHDGTMTLGVDGHIRGQFIIRTGGQDYPATYDLVRGTSG